MYGITFTTIFQMITASFLAVARWPIPVLFGNLFFERSPSTELNPSGFRWHWLHSSMQSWVYCFPLKLYRTTLFHHLPYYLEPASAKKRSVWLFCAVWVKFVLRFRLCSVSCYNFNVVITLNGRKLCPNFSKGLGFLILSTRIGFWWPRLGSFQSS